MYYKENVQSDKNMLEKERTTDFYQIYDAHILSVGLKPASTTPGILSMGIWLTPSLKHESPV